MIRLTHTATIRPKNLSSELGGTVLRVSDAEIYAEISDKLSGRIDRFTALSICAMSKFGKFLTRYASDDVGLVIGTMMGGWGFAFRELDNLHHAGFNRFSAFQATAWFPAAPQGETTILHNIRGYAKTCVGGLGCGLEAMIMGFHALQANHARAMIVGAVEAIDSDVAESAYRLKSVAPIISEGAAFLFLERDSKFGRPIDIALSPRPRVVTALQDNDSMLSLAPLITIADADASPREWLFEKGRQCLRISLGAADDIPTSR